VVGVNSEPMRRLKIKSSKTSLLIITRSPQWIDKMVYVLALAENKFWKYRNGRSRIIYIGTTKKGAGRPAASAVNKASQAFGKLRGVKTIEVHIATCLPHRKQKTWKHLESALLDTFRNNYHELPYYNKVRPRLKKGLFVSNGLYKFINKFDRSRG
jgi:hypothetical protein